MTAVIRHTKRTIVFLAALACVVIGIAGLILPVIPGLIFLAVAAIILSLFFPIIGEKMRHHTKKYPPLHSTIERMDEWVRRAVGDL